MADAPVGRKPVPLDRVSRRNRPPAVAYPVMALSFRIDPDARLIVAAGSGVLTDEDLFGYQQALNSRAEVAGYHELIDMSRVEGVALPSASRIQDLVDLAAGQDPETPRARIAVVAPTDALFGLGRMYQTYRHLDQRSTKQLGVFRTLTEALAFLGLDAAPPGPV